MADIDISAEVIEIEDEKIIVKPIIIRYNTKLFHAFLSLLFRLLIMDSEGGLSSIYIFILWWCKT